MGIRDYGKLIRKSHRYLGVFIGIQFLLWTLSGLCFSWTNINEIRGNHLRADQKSIKTIVGEISPSEVQNKLLKVAENPEVTSFRIVGVLENNYFEVVYKDKEKIKKKIYKL